MRARAMSADAMAARAAFEGAPVRVAAQELALAAPGTRWLALLVLLVTASVYAATAGLLRSSIRQ